MRPLGLLRGLLGIPHGGVVVHEIEALLGHLPWNRMPPQTGVASISPCVEKAAVGLDGAAVERPAAAMQRGIGDGLRVCADRSASTRARRVAYSLPWRSIPLTECMGVSFPAWQSKRFYIEGNERRCRMEAIPKFADMAKAAGFPRSSAYRPREVADATGVSYSAVCRCAADGSLESYLRAA